MGKAVVYYYLINSLPASHRAQWKQVIFATTISTTALIESVLTVFIMHLKKKQLSSHLYSIGLVTSLPIITIDQRQALLQPLKIQPQNPQRPREVLVSKSTNMRTDLDIRRVPQRIAARKRLRVRDVQRGAAQLSGLERSDQRALINHLAARNVSQVGLVARIVTVGRENGEFFGAEEVRGLRRQR